MANYSKIKNFDIADGDGLRVSIFFSGCPHRCPGCFNQETWDANNGQEYTAETESYLLELLKNPHIKGLSILGGEPFSFENKETVLNLCKKVRETFGHTKDIWIWTGFSFHDLSKEELEDIDVIIDGRFIESLKKVGIKHRGSSNQKIYKNLPCVGWIDSTAVNG